MEMQILSAYRDLQRLTKLNEEHNNPSFRNVRFSETTLRDQHALQNDMMWMPSN